MHETILNFEADRQNYYNSTRQLDFTVCLSLVEISGTKPFKDTKDLEFMDLQKIYIAGSSIKKADIPKKLTPVLDWRSRQSGLVESY
jgi:hypothetical protein